MEQMIPIFVILAILGIAIAILKTVARGDGDRDLRHIVAKPLLTAHERAFADKLRQAAASLGPYSVAPQVSMGAILMVKGAKDRSTSTRIRNRFASKIVDFLVLDASWNVAAIVELDDRTHSPDKDAARDRMTAAAGYPTVRLRDGRSIRVEEIRRQLRSAIPGAD